MRTSLNALLALILISTFAFSAYTQELRATEADVNTARNKAMQILSSTAHREIMSTEQFETRELPPVITFGFTREFQPPNKFHVVFKSKSGKRSEQSETIVVGEKGYIKTVGAKWQQDPNASTESGSPLPPDDDGNSTMPEVRVAHKPNILLNNVPADFYEVIKQYHYGAGRNANINIYTHRYWFDGEGRLLKSEFETSSTRSKSLSRRTSVYEYDPNIKIEEPNP
jgi:hypothetical protein